MSNGTPILGKEDIMVSCLQKKKKKKIVQAVQEASGRFRFIVCWRLISSKKNAPVPFFFQFVNQVFQLGTALLYSCWRFHASFKRASRTPGAPVPAPVVLRISGPWEDVATKDTASLIGCYRHVFALRCSFSTEFHCMHCSGK